MAGKKSVNLFFVFGILLILTLGIVSASWLSDFFDDFNEKARLKYTGKVTEEFSGEIVSFSVDKSSYVVGETATFAINVRNTGSGTWEGVGPESGTTYLQSQDFNSLGFYDYANTRKTRVGVDVNSEGFYRWRWNTGNLASGSSSNIIGKVKWEYAGTYNLCAGVVQEYVKWMDSEKFCTTVDVVTGPTSDQPTVLGCRASPTSINVGKGVIFTVTASPSGGECLLEYGDGYKEYTLCDESKDIVHTYDKIGSYYPKYSKIGEDLVSCPAITVLETTTKTPGPTNITSPTNQSCYDSDGINIYRRGIGRGTLATTGDYIEKYEFCSYGGEQEINNCDGPNCQVYEFSCVPDDKSVNYSVGVKSYYCPNGCINGACNLFKCEGDICLNTINNKITRVTSNGIDYVISLHSIRDNAAGILINDEPGEISQGETKNIGGLNLYGKSIGERDPQISEIGRVWWVELDVIKRNLEETVPQQFETDEGSEVAGNFETGESEEEIECEGCVLDGKCYSYNNRRSGNYCDISGEWKIQGRNGASCENNFECESNICDAGECVEGNFVQRVVGWFRELFGRG